MPNMVKLAASPSFKSDNPVAVAAWKAAKANGPLDVDYVTAIENVRLSGGIYMIVPEAPQTPVPGPRNLEDMSIDELKIMMLSLGVRSEKKMLKTDIVRLVRAKMGEIEIVDE
jgi:hypothetical protein